LLEQIKIITLPHRIQASISAIPIEGCIADEMDGIEADFGLIFVWLNKGHVLFHRC
jgi:hypothetical protein